MNNNWTWEELENVLGVTPSIEKLYSQEQIQKIEQTINHKLPQSYVDYIQRWGSGLICGLFSIWVPSENINIDMCMRYLDDKKMIKEHIEMDFWDEKYKHLVARLIPFGGSDNGNTLGWDPENILPNGEMAIYLLDDEQASAPFVGNTLLEFIGDYCINGKLDEAYPRGQGEKWDLPDTFTPFKDMH